MKILSIYSSYPSSVALTIDNKIIAAVNEERFTRIKNDERFPIHSISFCLKKAGIKAKDLDGVALASFISPFDDVLVRKSQWSVSDYIIEQQKIWKPLLVDKTTKKLKSLLEVFPKKIDFKQYPETYWKKNYKDPKRNEKHWRNRVDIVANFLNISKDKIKRIDHHKAHAYYSYYTSNLIGKKTLALTADGMGDGLNATINTFDKDCKFKRHYQTNICNIARIYRYTTLILGMKPNEHEYKVMGLAPYGKEKYSLNSYKVFAETLKVSGTKFVWNIKPSDSYFWFKERLDGHRFDSIAWGLQKWTEDLLTKWTANCMEKYKIYNVVFSGGVAMNIKAMGKISNLKKLKNIFVGGSASDESLSVSSAICLREELSKDNKKFKRIENLYLGPEATFKDENFLIKKIKRKYKNKYKILKSVNNKYVARKLLEGKIIGRCVGRMEFGQRALGNRSILADPRNNDIKHKINSAIKNRDFWMPFAPVIQKKISSQYLINPKNIESPQMTIGFQTTEDGHRDMAAGCHPADKSARAQILERKHNPNLYDLIEEFRKFTGVGALLNTSFNLHGFPIVNTPEEAFHVFINSELDGLLLSNFFILKK